MKHLVIASHGFLSRELIESAALIMGEGPDIFYLCMCETTTRDEIREILEEKLEQWKLDDEIIIMADVLGGSICTLCTEFLVDRRVHIVSGVNLPMVLTALGGVEFMDLNEMIEQMINSAKEGICYINQMQADSGKEEELIL